MGKHLIQMLFLFCLAGTATAGDMTVIIKGVGVNGGRLYIGLYTDPSEFPDGEQARGQYLDGNRETIRVVFADLPEGEVAIAVFQDENPNEELDTNFLGIPTEKYGFSGKPILGEPTFEEARVMVGSEDQTVIVEMQ
ncbi:MAG: DUF2141 domain-containing protein [Desulfobacterales bacterium]|nr:DUF2141 domain-containing protein [Desulfobacterales bacterium]